MEGVVSSKYDQYKKMPISQVPENIQGKLFKELLSEAAPAFKYYAKQFALRDMNYIFGEGGLSDNVPI